MEKISVRLPVRITGLNTISAVNVKGSVLVRVKKLLKIDYGKFKLLKLKAGIYAKVKILR